MPGRGGEWKQYSDIKILICSASPTSMPCITGVPHRKKTMCLFVQYRSFQRRCQIQYLLVLISKTWHYFISKHTQKLGGGDMIEKIYHLELRLLLIKKGPVLFLLLPLCIYRLVRNIFPPCFVSRSWGEWFVKLNLY